MKIDYDPDKNDWNIINRGLSFDDVIHLDWDSALIWNDNRREYGEDRSNVLAVLGVDGKLYALTYTIRGDVFWVISFRRANKRERRKYDENRS